MTNKNNKLLSQLTELITIFTSVNEELPPKDSKDSPRDYINKLLQPKIEEFLKKHHYGEKDKDDVADEIKKIIKKDKLGDSKYPTADEVQSIQFDIEELAVKTTERAEKELKALEALEFKANKDKAIKAKNTEDFLHKNSTALSTAFDANIKKMMDIIIEGKISPLSSDGKKAEVQITQKELDELAGDAKILGAELVVHNVKGKKDSIELKKDGHTIVTYNVEFLNDKIGLKK